MSAPEDDVIRPIVRPRLRVHGARPGKTTPSGDVRTPKLRFGIRPLATVPAPRAHVDDSADDDAL